MENTLFQLVWWLQRVAKSKAHKDPWSKAALQSPLMLLSANGLYWSHCWMLKHRLKGASKTTGCTSTYAPTCKVPGYTQYQTHHIHCCHSCLRRILRRVSSHCCRATQHPFLKVETFWSNRMLVEAAWFTANSQNFTPPIKQKWHMCMAIVTFILFTLYQKWLHWLEKHF